MPPGTAVSPLAGPERLASLGLLPERKVARALLATQVLGQRALTLLLKRLVVSVVGAQSCIGVSGLFERCNIEINRPFRLVCESLVGNPLDELGDLRDVIGDSCDDVRAKNIEGIHVLHEQILHALGEIREHGLVAGVNGLLVEGIEVGEQDIVCPREYAASIDGIDGVVHVVEVHLDLGFVVARLSLARDGSSSQHPTISSLLSHGVVGRIEFLAILEQQWQATLGICSESGKGELAKLFGRVGLLLFDFQ